MPHTVKLIPGQDTWFPTSGTQEKNKEKINEKGPLLSETYARHVGIPQRKQIDIKKKSKIKWRKYRFK